MGSIRAIALVALLGVCALATTTRMYKSATVPAAWKLTSDQVDLSETLRLTIGLYRNNAKKMDSIFWDVSTPTHRRYGEHLDNEAMRRLISPGPDALATVLQWIRSYGIEDVTVGRHEDSIKVVATLKQIEQLLGVHFRQYAHAASGRRLARAVDAVHVPTAIAKLVEVVGGHSGFPANTRNGFKPRAEHVMSAQTNVTPAVLYAAYNATEFPQAPAGQRNIQSFFEAQGQTFNPTDLSQFCQQFLAGTSLSAT